MGEKTTDQVAEGVVLVVGLGNPGPQYELTRHNIGFLFVDRLASRAGFRVDREKFKGLVGSGEFAGRKLVGLKPQTFMNLSGESVQPAAAFHKVPVAGIVAVHDDLDLPFGAVRLKQGGGAGGHNGLRSMDQQLGSPLYFRVRMGIGRPTHGDVVNYVLQRFDASQMAELDGWLDQGTQALEVLLTRGLKEAQNRFHATEPAKAPKPPKAG
jgi:PTH1 family peptidyl-tRNA hydrolase